jgi:gamma-glutamyl:cysteine ligase YbdK (ATP-grasp superfamily)
MQLYPYFKHKIAKRVTLALGLSKPAMGGHRDGYTGTRHNVIEHFCMESEAYKICDRWATKEDNAPFLTNVMRSEF